MARRVRGAVIYETAIVMPLVLLMLVSTIRAGILGYDQLQSDAAAMTYARYSALNIANPSTETKSLFGSTSNYTYATPGVSPAPKASSPIDWNQPIGTGGSNMGQFNRHGGQSVMVPAMLSAIVKAPGIKVWYGKYQKNNLQVNGADIEPLFLECGSHWMVGQKGTTGTDCSSNQDPTQYLSYFKQGENAPPFYLSQRYLSVCNTQGTNGAANMRPDEDYKNTQWSKGYGWNTCGLDNNGNPNTDAPTFLPLGGAAFLHVHNWYRTVAGWGGTASATQLSTLSTFREIACHERVYALIANSLKQDYYLYQGTLPTDANSLAYYNWAIDPVGLKAKVAAVGTHNSFPQIVRSWDADPQIPPGAIAAVDTDPTYQFKPLSYCGTPLSFFDSSVSGGTTFTP